MINLLNRCYVSPDNSGLGSPKPSLGFQRTALYDSQQLSFYIQGCGEAQEGVSCNQTKFFFTKLFRSFLLCALFELLLLFFEAFSAFLKLLVLFSNFSKIFPFETQMIHRYCFVLYVSGCHAFSPDI